MLGTMCRGESVAGTRRLSCCCQLSKQERENRDMSISARLATGAILLMAIAGCTDNRTMDRSSPSSSAGPAGTPGTNRLGSDQVTCPPGSQQPECLRPRTNPDD